MNTEPPKEPSAVIRVKDLYKIYRVGETKVRALNGVSFEIPKGEFVAIVGTSGSGKSTLLNMLAGLEKPTKGEILIGNVHIEKLTEKQLVAFRREKVGFIFQSYNLLNTMNAIENVALPGISRCPKERTAEKSKRVHGISRSRQTGKAYAKPDVRWTAAESGDCQSLSGKASDHLCGRAYRKPGLKNNHGSIAVDAKNCKGAKSDPCYGHT